MSAGHFKETRLNRAAPQDRAANRGPDSTKQSAPAPDGPLILPRLVGSSVNPSGRADDAPPLSDFERGLLAGKEEARASHEQTVRVMEAALETLKNEYQNLSRQIESSHLAALRQYLTPFLPSLLRETLSHWMTEVLEMACSQSVHGPVQLTAGPQTASQMQIWLEPHKDKVTLAVDESLTGLHMRLRWPNGGGDFDPQTIIETCQRQLASILGEYQQDKQITELQND